MVGNVNLKRGTLIDQTCSLSQCTKLVQHNFTGESSCTYSLDLSHVQATYVLDNFVGLSIIFIQVVIQRLVTCIDDNVFIRVRVQVLNLNIFKIKLSVFI